MFDKNTVVCLHLRHYLIIIANLVLVLVCSCWWNNQICASIQKETWFWDASVQRNILHRNSNKEPPTCSPYTLCWKIPNCQSTPYVGCCAATKRVEHTVNLLQTVVLHHIMTCSKFRTSVTKTNPQILSEGGPSKFTGYSVYIKKNHTAIYCLTCTSIAIYPW